MSNEYFIYNSIRTIVNFHRSNIYRYYRIEEEEEEEERVITITRNEKQKTAVDGGVCGRCMTKTSVNAHATAYAVLRSVTSTLLARVASGAGRGQRSSLGGDRIPRGRVFARLIEPWGQGHG